MERIEPLRGPSSPSPWREQAALSSQDRGAARGAPPRAGRGGSTGVSSQDTACGSLRVGAASTAPLLGSGGSSAACSKERSSSISVLVLAPRRRQSTDG